MKRLFDICAATLGLTILSPVLIIIAFFIKRDCGPIFYRGERVGKNKMLFKIYKFRTMVVNADKIGGPSTSEHDPRITKIGGFLRKYKLDELPQLINVVKGEMSLVGPRPEIQSEVATYGHEWDDIFSVRPGITDYSSIEFSNEGEIIANSGIEDAHLAYRTLIQPRKLALQLKYAHNHSMIIDISLILKTITAIVR